MQLIKHSVATLPLLFAFLFSPLALSESREKQVELGRYLFNDVRLSKFGNRSCSLCHSPDHGWSNTFSRSIDIHNRMSTLNTPSLLNSGSYQMYMQRSIGLVDLKETIKLPLFSEQPEEMGVTEPLLLERLEQAQVIYPPLFEHAFGSDEITVDRVLTALAEYVKTIKSTDTPYSRYLSGDSQALSEQQKKGLDLFNSDRLKCSQCHGGILLNTPEHGQPFANTGLYGIRAYNGEYRYPHKEPGLQKFTGNSKDNGKFRIPSLINVANTGPWGHDGSFRRLSTVISAYAAGGRVTVSGPNKGDGRLHPEKDERITGFSITRVEKEQLLSFLSALTVSGSEVPLNHQSPFCSLVPLKNKPDAQNCLPPFVYKKVKLRNN